jgi:hypothetical protein
MESSENVMSYLPIFNVVAYIAVVVAFIIAGQRVLNHTTMLDVFYEHRTKFTPSESTFIIWYLIFIALGIFIVYQVLPAYRSNVLVRRVGWWFCAHAVGLFVFPFFWNFKILWPSVIAILWMLVTAVAIYWRLGIDYSKKGQARTIEAPAGTVQEEKSITQQEFWVVQAPFSLLLGWLFPLTILSLWVASTYAAEGDQADVWTYQGWSALMMTILTLISTLFILFRSDFIVGLVIAWSQLGIAGAHRHDPVVETAGLVNGFLVLIGALLTAFFVAFRYFTARKERAGYVEIK